MLLHKDRLWGCSARCRSAVFALVSFVLLGPALALASTPRPLPESELGEHLLVPYGTVERHQVFLNFDGETLTAGGNNSATNTTDLITVPTLDYPALSWERLGGREQGERAILEELRLLFMDFSVEFVTSRPAVEPYTMAMIGGYGEGCSMDSAGTVGVAPMDCRDGSKDDIVLIYGDAVSGSPRALAYVIAHELGHAFGLEHSADEGSIMYPTQTSGTCSWKVAGLAEPSVCGRSEQDDRQVLLDNLGPGEGDSVGPGIWFLHPGDGAVLPPSFSFAVVAADDLRVHHVELFVDGEPLVALAEPPFATAVSELADGEHLIRAEVYDYKPNIQIAEVLVWVDRDCASAGSCHDGKRGLWAACDSGDDCSSGFCADGGEGGRCVAACDQAAPVCPAASSCLALEDAAICAEGESWSLLAAATEGAGCAAAGRRPSGGTAGALGLLLALLLAWRRRRAG